MMGWDSDFLQQAVNTCTNPSGRIQDCPLFNVVDESKATSCKMKKGLLGSLFKEDVLGPMVSLPGGVKVGVGNDEDNQPATTSIKQAPTLTYRPGDKPSTPGAPLPGQAFKEGSNSSPKPQPTTTSYAAGAQAIDTTPAPPPPASPSAQPSYFSTEYITNGNQVTKILWEEKFVTVVEYGDSPAPTPNAGANYRRRHVHRGHGHGKF